MKRLLLPALLVASLTRAQAAETPAPASVSASTSIVVDSENLEENLKVGDDKRRYWVHLPPPNPSPGRLPAVIAFHDNLSNAYEMSKTSGWNALADQKGFIVVYPEGSGRFQSFNAGHCCGYAQVQQIDDVAFTHLIIDDIEKRFSADPGRIYAAGFGNGGMMVYRLAYEMYDQIAAVGSVAGDLQVVDSSSTSPKRPVPIIYFHGMKDEKVPFQGGAGKNTVGSMEHASVAQTIGYWVNANKCQPNPVEVRTENDYVMTRYEPSVGVPGAPVILYVLPAGGHAWPGGVDLGGYLGDGGLISTVNATSIMWDFFDQFNIGGQRKND